MTELRTAKRNGGEIEMNTNNHDDYTATQTVHPPRQSFLTHFHIGGGNIPHLRT
ncbi:uncharacterized protein METZ01_LOCUS458735, partial [marine metagenome]